MKAILVKYKGPTTHKPSRWIASAKDVKPITIPFNHALNQDDNAKEAAIGLCFEKGWPVDLVGGMLPNGDYVFCFKNQ